MPDADAALIELFVLLHDSGRRDEGGDRSNGERAGRTCGPWRPRACRGWTWRASAGAQSRASSLGSQLTPSRPAPDGAGRRTTWRGCSRASTNSPTRPRPRPSTGVGAEPDVWRAPHPSAALHIAAILILYSLETPTPSKGGSPHGMMEIFICIDSVWFGASTGSQRRCRI
jgi:hypothetical protein